MNRKKLKRTTDKQARDAIMALRIYTGQSSGGIVTPHTVAMACALESLNALLFRDDPMAKRKRKVRRK